MKFRLPIAFFVLLVAASVAVSGCGKKQASTEDTPAEVKSAQKDAGKAEDKAATGDKKQPEVKVAVAEDPVIAKNDPKKAASKAKPGTIYPGAKEVKLDIPADDLKAMPKGGSAKKYNSKAKFADVAKWYSENYDGTAMVSPPNEGPQQVVILSIDEKASRVHQILLEEQKGSVDITHIYVPASKEEIKQAKAMEAQAGKQQAAQPAFDADQDTAKAQKEVGIKVYPAGKVTRGAIITSKEAPGFKNVMLGYTTNDKPEKVVDFYKKEFQGKSVKQMKHDQNKAEVIGYTDEANRTTYTATVMVEEGETRVILSKQTMPKQ